MARSAPSATLEELEKMSKQKEIAMEAPALDH